MNPTLENDFFQLNLDPGGSCWSLSGRREGDPVLTGARMRVLYRSGGGRVQSLEGWEPVQVSGPEMHFSPHGPLRQLILDHSPDATGLRYRLVFALPEERPLFLWKVSVANGGAHPIHLDRIDLLRIGLPSADSRSQITFQGSGSARLSTSDCGSPLSFFSNGWQSWSYSGTYTAQDRYRRTRLGFFRAPTEADSGTPRPAAPGHFASDLFGVLGDPNRRSALLAGFLSQRQHFGSLEARIHGGGAALELWANGDGARLEPGGEISTDWACLHFLEVDSPDPLGPYLEAVAREHRLGSFPSIGEGLGLKSRVPTGWCSWYQYSSEQYTGELSAQDVRNNLQALDNLRGRLPLEIVQIDDGFEAQVGDWYAFCPSFPEGVAPLAAEIRAAGFTPGLWLAPFIVHPRSRLAAERPDWLLRGRFGRPVNAGYFWNSFATALDLTHPEALEYAAGLVHTAVHEWGFPYLKLDFLYAGALPGRRRDPSRTRAQAFYKGMEALRQAAGEQAYLLGCGCPLGPAIGLVDAMRISTDTARRWYPAIHRFQGFLKGEPTLPSARNAAHNALTRAPFHRRWWVNDPDCLLLRPETHLTLPEVQSLTTAVALTGGSFLLSDNLAALPQERLRIAEALLPVIGKTPQVLDWFDSATPCRLRLDLAGPAGSWHLLGLFNWSDRPQEAVLQVEEFGLDPLPEYFAREFWSSTLNCISSGSLQLERLPAHGVALFAMRPVTPEQPQYLGSDLHISQGLEVASWEVSLGAPTGKGSLLKLRLERPGPAEGSIDLALPYSPTEARLDGRPAEWHRLLDGLYRIPVSFHQNCLLQLALK